jgi:hypothetical protein
MSTFLLFLIVVGCIILVLVIVLGLTIRSAGKRRAQHAIEQEANKPSDRTSPNASETPAQE